VSYQVLARKWRPQNFSQVVGQQHVLTALSNGLAQNKVHHAYLFSGTRGVGKTTIARILAKSLNCEQGVTATPCGKCEHCIAIDQGRFVDLLEIDAASRTKVDDTRELLDNVQYKPAVGRYKVYLIDEVHMLSKHSFNALLKTLEEPPEYVKFLLATTDPQKLPITVLSRCLQFHLKAILPEQIEAQLAFILQQEQSTFEHTALNVIAKAADGSMRDALSLTDQALAFGAGNIEYSSVLKMLGTLDNSHLEYLLHFIASGNVEKVFQKIEEFVALGADFAKLHQELASLCHQIALQQLQPSQTQGEKSAIQLISERLNPEEVQLYYQIAIQGFKDYRFAPNGKIALEMTVMRLLAFKPANYIELDEQALVNNEVVTELPATNNTSPQSMHAQTMTSNATQAVPTHTEPEHVTAPIVPAVLAVEMPIREPAQAKAPTITAESNVIEPAKAEMPVIESATDETPQVSPVVTPAQPVPPAMADIVTEAPVIETAIVESTQIETSAIENPPTQTIAPSASETTTQPVMTESIEQVTHSRNMLRSHRLKRNETKKSQATTDLHTTDPVVAAPSHVASHAPVALPNTETAQAPAHHSPATTPAPSHSDHLPPLDQYQDNEFDAHNMLHDYDDQYEAYIPPEMQSSAPVQNVAPIPSGQNIAPTTLPVSPQTSFTGEVQVNNQVAVPQSGVEIAQPQAVASPALEKTFVAQHDTALGQHAFFSDQAFEAPEIDTAKYVEDKLTDPWSLAIQAMGVVGLVKLLAKNCVMKKVEQQIVLTLQPGQQHLLNNSSLCEELQKQLKAYYGETYSMYIEVGNVDGELTAFQSEMALYEQYLDNAKRAIVEDQHIQKLAANCGAKVYENSIIPL